MKLHYQSVPYEDSGRGKVFAE